MLLKHAGTVWMAAVWLLLSLFRCAFEPATSSGSPDKEAVARFAANSSAQAKQLFHRFSLNEGDFAFEKCGSVGPFDFCLDPASDASWRHAAAVSFAGGNQAQSWQFSLRAALNPRAPCLG